MFSLRLMMSDMQYGDFVMFETISNIDTLQKGIKQNR